jgi:ribosomal protein S3
MFPASETVHNYTAAQTIYGILGIQVWVFKSPKMQSLLPWQLEIHL